MRRTLALLTAAVLLTAGCGAKESPSGSHTVIFEITGDAKLTTLTYVIDGKPTTLKSVHLPWKKTLKLPKTGTKHTWRVSSEQTDGASQIVVTVDGRPLTNTSCQGSGCTGHASGSVRD